MLLDIKVLNGFRERKEIYSSQIQEDLVLDSSMLQPAGAATKILEHVDFVIRSSKVAEE